MGTLDYTLLIKRIQELVNQADDIKTKETKIKRTRIFIIWAVNKGYISKENSQHLFKQIDNIQINPDIQIIKISQTNVKNEQEKTSQPVEKAQRLKKHLLNLTDVVKNRLHFSSNHPLTLRDYLNYGTVLVFLLVLIFGIYQQFINKPNSPLAYPTSLTSPGITGSSKRFLSFQGRLTDSTGNPITSRTDVTFKLWNDSSSTNPTNLLYSSYCVGGTYGVVPDQDGIFNVLIGQDCGNASTPSGPETGIPASVFTENADIWLGVTVSTDAEMTPRQHIANVGYAMNSETLQGLPPGTSTSNIPYINSSGTLLIAAASPTLQSSSGTFTIKGQTLAFSTPSGSGGNISFSPDTGGNTLFTSGNVGIGTTSPSNFKLQLAGNIGPNADNTYNLGSNSFRWANIYGVNIFQGGNQVCDSGGTGCPSGATSWTLSSTNLYPTSTSYNVGIGKTNPGEKLDVSGNATVSGNITMGNTSQLQTAYGPLKLAYKSAPNVWTTGLYLQDVTGNIGIGTTAPLATLHVSGSTRLDLGSDATGDIFYRNSSGTLTRLAVGSSSQVLTGGTTPSWTNVTSTTCSTCVVTNPSGAQTITAASSTTGLSIAQAGTPGTADIFNVTNNGGGTKYFQVDSSGNTTLRGTLTFSGVSSDITTGTNEDLIISPNGSGNVGIANTAPKAKLDVTGTASVSGNLTIGNTSAIQPAYGPLTLKYKSGANTYGTGLVIQDTTGNIGINNTAPLASLDITPANAAALQIEPFGASAGNTGELRFMELAANGTNYSSIKAPDSLGSNLTYTLPSTAPTTGQVLSSTNTGVLSWTTVSSGSSSWSSLTSPSANLSLQMFAGGNPASTSYNTTFTWGSATSGDLFTLVDTANNSGNGYMLNVGTATGSNVKPLKVAARTTTIIDTTAAGGLTLGSGSGNIAFTLSNAADVLTATKALTLAGAYSGNDYTFTRNLTGGANAMTGAVFSVTDTSTGSNISPDLIFGNDANSSFTGNLLKLQTNSTTKFLVDASGNASTSGNLTLGNGSALQPTYGPLTLKYKSGANTWATGMVVQDTTGNVGIGTTAPGGKLEVAVSNPGDGFRVSATGINSPQFSLYNGSTQNGAYGLALAGNNYSNISQAGDIVIRSLNGNPGNVIIEAGTNTGNILFTTGTTGSDTEKMRLSNAGRLGIGTTNPGSLLDVNGTSNLGGATTVGGLLTLNSAGITGGGLSSDCSGTRQKLLWSSGSNNFTCGNDGGTVQIIKGSDTTLTSQTTLQNTDFTWSVGANETWFFTIFSDISVTANPPGVKFGLSTPTSSTCAYSALTVQTSAGSSTSSCSSTISITSTNANDRPFELTGSVKTTNSGTITIQWAQDSTSGTGITMRAGSFMIAYKGTGTDLAEAYYTKDLSITPGTIISLDEELSKGIKKTTEKYSPKMLGIVSTQPGLILADNKGLPSPDLKPVLLALSGRIPVQVSTINGPIRAGDPITSSDIPGVGMKATKPGQVVAKALEDFDPANGKGTSYVCPHNPNTQCGTILAFANLSWYDPDLELTSTGDTKFLASLQKNNTNGGYDIIASTGEVIQTIGNYAEVVIGKITTGVIEAKKITTENLSAFNGHIETLTSNTLITINGEIEKLSVSSKINTPIIETTDIVATGEGQIAQIKTNQIKPLGDNLTIDLNNNSSPQASEADKQNKGQLSKVIIKGLNEKIVASIDAAGNATFSGTLASNNVQSNSLSTNTASVSGQLIAGTINTTTIGASEASLSGKLIASEIQADTIKSTQLDNLNSQLNANKSTIDNLSSNVNDVQKLLADIKNNPLPNAQYYQQLTSDSSIPMATSPASIVNNGTSTLAQLTVTDDTNLYKASISDSLTVGNIYIHDNSILSLNWDLNISSLSKINFFDGNAVIAKDGTITTKATLIAQAGVKTDTIQALNPHDNIDVKLTTEQKNIIGQNSSLNVLDQTGTVQASIDASGSAKFNDLSLNNYLDATSSAAIVSAVDNFNKNGLFAPALDTSTHGAGIGVIPTGSNEVIIYNDRVKDTSLIYLTPVTSTPGYNMTVVKKYSCGASQESNCKPYFEVAVDKITSAPIQFNWLIIN